MKEEHIEVEGVIAAVLAGTMFRVELENKHVVLATICGKMRKRWVRLTAGDRVKMEMSPYDLNKGGLTWRLKKSVSESKAVMRRALPCATGFILGLLADGCISNDPAQKKIAKPDQPDS